MDNGIWVAAAIAGCRQLLAKMSRDEFARCLFRDWERACRRATDQSNWSLVMKDRSMNGGKVKRGKRRGLDAVGGRNLKTGVLNERRERAWRWKGEMGREIEERRMKNMRRSSRKADPKKKREKRRNGDAAVPSPRCEARCFESQDGSADESR